MNKIYPPEPKKESLDISLCLAESMDQPIGEATTVMGAMITELMRRSLRGGILKIGEELSTFVTDQVDHTLTERVPEVERAAAAVAEETAQRAATRVATEEVQALEARTGETTKRLADQIVVVQKETERKTEEAERKTRETVESTRSELNGRLEERAKGLVTQILQVEQKTQVVVEEQTQTLTRQIAEVDRRAGETTRQTAEQLSGQIAETERRVCETTQAEISQRLHDVLEKAREGSTILKARLKSLEDLTEGLGQQVREEQTARRGEIQTHFSKLNAEIDKLGQKLSHGIELCQARLKDEVRDLRRAHDELGARVAALEQPKGFFSRLFGKKKDA